MAKRNSQIVLTKPKVKFRSMKKDFGLAYKNSSTIILHDRMRPRMCLEIYIHEHLHCFLPDASENTITRMAGLLADGLWEHGFRLKK